MILITGGSGYLGRHIAGALLGKGHAVRILDVQTSPFIPPKAQFIKADMRDAEAVGKAVKGAEAVIHLAFIQSLSRRPLREKWEINAVGTEIVLKAALKHKVRRLVNASTTELYGARPPVPCTEEAPRDHPVGWYGRHKLHVERLLLKYLQKGLESTSLRMPGVCGPGSYNHGPMLDIMDRIIAHKPVPMAGNGNIPASLAHYRDVADAFLLALDSPNAPGEAFNIATRAPATHKSLLLAMKRAVRSRSPLIPASRGLTRIAVTAAVFAGLSSVPDHQVDYAFHPMHISIEKAARLLGYDPRHSAEDCARDQILGYLERRDFVRERNRTY